MSQPARSYDLERFVAAQSAIYATVVDELAAGRKRTHRMWFIFPQIAGLGRSSTARHYAIADVGEAVAYLAHPVLGPRLVECTELVNAARERELIDIFGAPDDLKFHSSMTLFSLLPDHPAAIGRAIATFFDGAVDAATVQIVTRQHA